MTINLNKVKYCTLCRERSLVPTRDSFKVSYILERWEKEASARFRAQVLEYYKKLATKSVRLYHCSTCDFRIFLPIVAGTTEFYEDITANNNYYVSDRWEFKQAVNDLKRYNCQNVLDIGCGSGHFLDLVKKKMSNVEAHGYEFNSAAAETARNKGNVVYSGSFPESIRERDRQLFDALCMFQVLEHFPDPVDLIKNASTLLKQGGLLIVAVPNCEGPVRLFSTALTDIPPHHITRWCEKAFRIGLQSHGFKVRDIRYEPLPSYLWDSYLPAILEQTFVLPKLGALMNRKGITKRLIRFLRYLKIKELWGVTGHSLYVLISR